MNRRSFLGKLGSAGVVLLVGGRASARRLLLVDPGDVTRISHIEWMLYDTGRLAQDGTPAHRCAVRITGSCGVQGWADLSGEVMPDPDGAGLIRETLLGRQPSENEAIWRQLYESGVALGALAAVDIALWDLLGRLEARPVHALLSTVRQAIPACVATGFNLGDPQQYGEYALACKERGAQSVKVHPYINWGAGCGGRLDGGAPDRDMAAYRAVREAVGPHYPCIADNRCTYTFDEALRVGRLLDDLGYRWYESPMPENADWLDRYVALAAAVRTPICAPKTLAESYPPRISWITARACDVSSMHVLLGGFTACAELALACEAAGVGLHLSNIGPDAYAHVQLLAATSEAVMPYAEMHSFAQETRIQPGRATPESVMDDQGRVAVPQTPGMGIELDWQYIWTHRVT